MPRVPPDGPFGPTRHGNGDRSARTGPGRDPPAAVRVQARRCPLMSGVSSGALLGMSTAATTVLIVVVVGRRPRHRRVGDGALAATLAASFVVRAGVRRRGRRCPQPSAAERDCSGRLERHETLPLRSLTPQSQARYLAAWDGLQAGFVDRPQHAVVEADELIRSAMVERGYPAQSFDQQVADLSVEHARRWTATATRTRWRPGRRTSRRPRTCAARSSATASCSSTSSVSRREGDDCESYEPPTSTCEDAPGEHDRTRRPAQRRHGLAASRPPSPDEEESTTWVSASASS